MPCDWYGWYWSISHKFLWPSKKEEIRSETEGKRFSDKTQHFLVSWYWLLNWLVVSTHLKNISELGWLFPTYGTIKNVPNHQPVNNDQTWKINISVMVAGDYNQSIGRTKICHILVQRNTVPDDSNVGSPVHWLQMLKPQLGGGNGSTFSTVRTAASARTRSSGNNASGRWLMFHELIGTSSAETLFFVHGDTGF